MLTYRENCMKKIFLLFAITTSIIATVIVRSERDHSLIHAINSCDIKQVELAITKGGRVNELLSGESPFHIAIELNRLNIVKFLMVNGAELNFPTKSGQSPLDIAISKGYFEIIRFLNEKGAKTKYNCIYCEHTILEYVVATNNIDGLMFIEKNGGNIYGTNINDGFSLLHLATLLEKFEAAKYLIHKKVPVNACDKWGRTPLHCAMEDGNLQIIQYLIDNGADVTIKDHSGLLPADLAKFYKNERLYNYLNSINKHKKPFSTERKKRDR